MSLLKVCDICGKAEKRIGDIKKADRAKAFNSTLEAQFDDRPIRLSIPSYNGDRYNIYVEIKMEHEADTKILDEMYENKDNIISVLFGGGEEDGFPTSGGISDMLKNVTLNNPHPKICTRCKREILKLVRAYGSEKGFRKI